MKSEKHVLGARNYKSFFFQLHRTIQTLAEKDDKANSACKDIEERKANYQLLNRELTNEKVSAFNCLFFVWESLINQCQYMVLILPIFSFLNILNLFFRPCV